MSLPHIRRKAPPSDVTLKNSVKAAARARARRLGHAPFSTTSLRSEDKHFKDTLPTPSAQLHLQWHRWATGEKKPHLHSQHLPAEAQALISKMLKKKKAKKKNTFNDCHSKGVQRGACIQSESAGRWWKNAPFQGNEHYWGYIAKGWV